MIVGICGLIGSGKGTVADILVDEYDFKKVSFADSLKDAVSKVFNWPRSMLEGDTAESREWREQIDHWWANRLDIPHLSPRWVLQYWGTDVCRIGFHQDIWIASLERKILSEAGNYVVPDTRFPNEVKIIQRLGGKVWRVKRGEEPEWYNIAEAANDDKFLHAPEAHEAMIKLGVHHSEWAWIGQHFDCIIENNGTIEDLKDIVKTNIVYDTTNSKL